MKTLLMSLVLFGFANAALADDWPYDAICRKFNATSETVTLTQPREQTVVLCKFGVGSFIEKNTLDKSWGGGWETWAVREYKNNRPEPFGESCARYGAWIYPAKNSRGQEYRLCIFGDNSMMEERTFGYGSTSGWNREMDWALGIN